MVASIDVMQDVKRVDRIKATSTGTAVIKTSSAVEGNTSNGISATTYSAHRELAFVRSHWPLGVLIRNKACGSAGLEQHDCEQHAAYVLS
eukprot:338613-Prymnesium_polylepis.1